MRQLRPSHRLQFSLRSLFVIVTVLAVAAMAVRLASFRVREEPGFHTGPYPQTNLARAIANHDRARILELLAANPLELKATDLDGRTPLHWAVLLGQADIVDLLLNAGAPVNAATIYGVTPVMTTADPSIIARLLSAGADPNVSSASGVSTYYLAATQHDVVRMRLFEQAGFKPDLPSAIVLNDVHRINELVGGNPELLRSKVGPTKLSMLHIASLEGNLSAAQVLMGLGCDCNARDDRQSTPLHATAIRGTRDIVELLVTHGADIEAIDSNGDTPLHVACWLGNLEVVKALLSNGASTIIRNRAGETPAEIALSAQRKGFDRKRILKDLQGESSRASMPAGQ